MDCGDVVVPLYRFSDLRLPHQLRQPGTGPDIPGAPVDLTLATVDVPEVNGGMNVTVTITNAAEGRFLVSAPWDDNWDTGRVMWYRVRFIMPDGHRKSGPKVWIDLR